MALNQVHHELIFTVALINEFRLRHGLIGIQKIKLRFFPVPFQGGTNISSA